MNTTRILLNVFLGLLLFLCLMVIGPGIVVQTTLLNTGYVESRLYSLDLSQLVKDEASNAINDVADLRQYGYLSGDIADAVIAKQQEIKQALVPVITDTHHYLVSGDSFDLAETFRKDLAGLQSTVAIPIIDSLDLKPVAREVLIELIPPELSGYNIEPYIEAAVPITEIWLKQQLTTLVPQAYNYVFGQSAQPVTIIELSGIIEQVRLAVREQFLSSPPQEAAGFPPSMLAALFDSGWSVLVKSAPVSLRIDLAEALGPPGEFANSLDSADSAIHQARPWMELYQWLYWLVVGTAAVLVALIVAFNMKVAPTGFTLGVVFLLAGAVGLVGSLVGQGIAAAAVNTAAGVPESMAPWLAQTVYDVFRPMLIFSSVLAFAGVALLVIAVLVHRAEESI
jgi:hypothetical protein